MSDLFRPTRSGVSPGHASPTWKRWSGGGTRRAPIGARASVPGSPGHKERPYRPGRGRSKSGLISRRWSDDQARRTAGRCRPRGFTIAVDGPGGHRGGGKEMGRGRHWSRADAASFPRRRGGRCRPDDPGRRRSRPARAVLWHQPVVVLSGGGPSLRPARQPLLSRAARRRADGSTDLAVRGHSSSGVQPRRDQSGGARDGDGG